MTGPAPKLAVAASKWGVPDPRDKAAYDQLDGLTLSGWAWQFLRRNPVYREHWQDHERFGLWAPVTPWGDPEAPPNEAPPFVAQVTPMIGVSALLNRIGLEGVPPEPEHLQLGVNQVAPIVDLGRGLDDQLALAKEHLKFLQQQLVDAGLVVIIKPRARKEWASYLRLLDAEDAGLTDGEIRQLLFPHADREQQRVKFTNHRKSAHHMRDDGYKQIACVASK